MRFAPFFFLALLALAPVSVGRAQDFARELKQSQQIQQKATDLSRLTTTPSSIPAGPALETPAPPVTAKQDTPTAEMTELPPASALSSPVPEISQNFPTPSVPSLETQPLSSNIDSSLNPFKKKPSVPRYEAAYRAALQREAEAKRKKKSLLNAISEEITDYGLYFLLGIVLFLLIYALRKEPTKLSAPKPEPAAPGQPEKKDIWEDNLNK